MKIIITLLLVLIITSCKGQENNLKSMLKTYDVSTKSSCEKKGGYWYKDKCWASFEDEGIANEDIDNEVHRQLKAIQNTNISVNNIDYPIISFLLEKAEAQIILITTFNQNENSNTILQFIKEEDFKENKKFKSEAIFFKKNVVELSRSGVDVDSLIENPDFEGELDAVVSDINDLNVNFNGSLANSKSEKQVVISYTTNGDVLGAGNSKIEVKGNEAFLNGELGTLAYVQIKDLIKNHPEVKTLVLGTIMGSLNDAVNMHTGRLVREASLTTKVLSNSTIASGGVDLFCAGKERIITQGAKIGVHSWSGGDFTAIELPRNHPAHQYQIEYFTMCFGKEKGPNFYFYTLESAPFDGIHWMKDDEVKKWEIATTFIESKSDKGVESFSKNINVSQEKLLGKWHLKTVTMQGETASAKKIFATSKVFQEYFDKNMFKSYVGNETSEGSWKLLEGKTIEVNSDRGKTTFQIQKFDNNKMTLSTINGGQDLILNYEKQ